MNLSYSDVDKPSVSAASQSVDSTPAESEVTSVPVVSLDQCERHAFEFHHEGRGVYLEQRSEPLGLMWPAWTR
ncbi:hypothetical protein F2P81_021458 [Scophthalmus maximus]|uniref:Uncharacterized protein n=1 Tax=Scophthalmus maximus TaxID=52904 RepID=A0A6A4S6G0_SCOMX|nr:hypothetical protein F2P81_021458 [Scophthalmus maximus]